MTCGLLNEGAGDEETTESATLRYFTRTPGTEWVEKRHFTKTEKENRK
jgi:hypothetical protein